MTTYCSYDGTSGRGERRTKSVEVEGVNARARYLPLRRSCRAVALAGAASLLQAGSAEAHVKWFSDFELAQRPRELGEVLQAELFYLLLVSVVLLMIGAAVEKSRAGEVLRRGLDRATPWLRQHSELIVRAGCCFFFTAIWSLGGILLTPELKSDSPAVGMLQLAIAAGMLSRRTLPLSAVGIAAIFGIGVWNYGLFHLADYPVFLGVAAYLAMIGTRRNLLQLTPIDVLRWSASITLMWASIEKWAYPEWTFPILQQHAGMTLGFDSEFFMRAAGAVEFALAFSLICSPLVRRIGAIALVMMFLSAVISFGKVDFIGHSVIVVALCAIISDSSSTSSIARTSLRIPVAYGAAVACFFSLYYAGHAVMFSQPAEQSHESMLAQEASQHGHAEAGQHVGHHPESDGESLAETSVPRPVVAKPKASSRLPAESVLAPLSLPKPQQFRPIEEGYAKVKQFPSRG